MWAIRLNLSSSSKCQLETQLNDQSTYYSCNLFKSNYSRSYETFRLYADHSIKSTSDDSWKNMNEQDQDDYWYERWLSLIF